MCTASHNPKGYTGAKLVKRGALALSGDSGIGELRDIVTAGEPGDPVAQPGAIEHEDVAEAFREAALGYIDASRVGPMRVVLDGGNGMAGPMVGPLLRTFPLDRVETYWEPNGEFPDHEPNPLLEENRQFIIDNVCATSALTWASPGTATPTAASSSTTPASSWPATSSPRCSPRRCCARSRARPCSTTCAPRARCATSSSAPAAPPRSTASATRSSRRACARPAPRSAARCRATTTSATSTAPTPARSRRC